jgi:hypothetical protein
VNPANRVAIFREGVEVDAAINESLRSARILHKKLGVEMAISKNGKVVIIPPEEIVIDPPADH